MSSPFIWIEGWWPMGFTKVPQQDKVYFRACPPGGPSEWHSSTTRVWSSLPLSSPDTLGNSCSPSDLSLFLCKLKTVKAPFGSEMTGWRLWQGEQSWSREGPGPRKGPSSFWHLCGFLLPLKCCISLRVHKSWHVCKERHGRNSYASPYNKHVVNNLYLEYNLS